MHKEKTEYFFHIQLYNDLKVYVGTISKDQIRDQ